MAIVDHFNEPSHHVWMSFITVVPHEDFGSGERQGSFGIVAHVFVGVGSVNEDGLSVGEAVFGRIAEVLCDGGNGRVCAIFVTDATRGDQMPVFLLLPCTALLEVLG